MRFKDGQLVKVLGDPVQPSGWTQAFNATWGTGNTLPWPKIGVIVRECSVDGPLIDTQPAKIRWYSVFVDGSEGMYVNADLEEIDGSFCDT